MSDPISLLCCSCRSPRIHGTCELCGEPVCKTCLRFLAADSFAFRDGVPERLSHSRYCDRCFASEVEPALADYEAVLERAKEVLFIPRSFRGQVFVLKKANDPVRVTECPDRDETILRLAFQAAAGGDYNALIQGEVTGQKVRNHGYQKSSWSGSGVPALLDLTKLNRNDYLEEVWRRGH